MRKLWVSFSGGRTSAYMSVKLKQHFSDRYEMKFVFANTGLEHEETLNFVNRIDKEFQLGVVWVESVLHPEKGKASTHRVVDFESAHRGSDIFEKMIDVYGIPNTSFPHCTRELKINPMKDYIKSIGWGAQYRAIGIRADEMRRVSESASKDRILYPLVDMFPTTKEDVLDWFEGKPYDLKIKEREGNCVQCWKKSDVKIIQLLGEYPERFDFFDRMEKEKGHYGAGQGARVFFRKNRSVEDMRKLSDAVGEIPKQMSFCETEECGME